MNSELERIFASFSRSGKMLATPSAVITVDAPNAPALPRANKGYTTTPGEAAQGHY